MNHLMNDTLDEFSSYDILMQTIDKTTTRHSISSDRIIYVNDTKTYVYKIAINEMGLVQNQQEYKNSNGPDKTYYAPVTKLYHLIYPFMIIKQVFIPELKSLINHTITNIVAEKARNYSTDMTNSIDDLCIIFKNLRSKDPFDMFVRKLVLNAKPKIKTHYNYAIQNEAAKVVRKYFKSYKPTSPLIAEREFKTDNIGIQLDQNGKINYIIIDGGIIDDETYCYARTNYFPEYHVEQKRFLTQIEHEIARLNKKIETQPFDAIWNKRMTWTKSKNWNTKFTVNDENRRYLIFRDLHRVLDDLINQLIPVDIDENSFEVTQPDTALGLSTLKAKETHPYNITIQSVRINNYAHSTIYMIEKPVITCTWYQQEYKPQFINTETNEPPSLDDMTDILVALGLEIPCQ